jgi:dTDP-glucose 4,6-dehydratase
MNKNQPIMVTGGSGFMGSNFIYYLLKDEFSKVINYSKETYAIHNRTLEDAKKYAQRRNQSFEDIEGDMLDATKLLKVISEYRPKYIVHFAAETHVDRSFKYPEEFIQTNIVGAFRLLEVLRHIKSQRPELIHISTDEVFGDIQYGKVTEISQLRPQNPYSATKAAIESLLHAWRAAYGLKIKIIRPTNNYGPRQHPEKLIAKIITRCLSNRPYTLWKGNAIRNWLYVKDLYNAIMFVIQCGRDGESYNVSSSDDLTVDKVNSTILDIMDKQELFQGYEGQRLKLDQRYALNNSEIRKLGWRQQYKFGQGITEAIEWYRQNPWFWECVWSQ